MVDGIVGKKTIEAINKQIELINRKTVNTDRSEEHTSELQSR